MSGGAAAGVPASAAGEIETFERTYFKAIESVEAIDNRLDCEIVQKTFDQVSSP